MAALQGNGSMNTEAADPEAIKQELHPKSYASIVVDGDQENDAKGTNGANGTMDRNGADGTNHSHETYTASIEYSENPESTNPKAPTLKNVDTDLANAEGTNDEKPKLERQESTHEYSAAGLDDSPKSPPRYKHRKSPSKNISMSQEKVNAEGVDFGTNTINDLKPQEAQDKKTAVFENVEGERNGSKLVSVKQTGKYDTQPGAARTDAPNLVSGRKAGQRWQTSGIRFAPMNVPLQRRLQTLVVLFHTLSIALFISAFFFLCAIPLFWPLLIPYMIYCMSSKASTSGTLSHRSDFLRSLPVWSLFASYFPARLHRTQELPPTRKYIFAAHPHGIISHSFFAAFATEALGFSQLFPGIKNTLLTLDSNFRIPIYRDYALAMGLCSVSKESCENLLSKGGTNNEGMGRAITIVVGGARESLDAQPYSLRLVLKRRKGFVKMAIRTGADLVPVLAFGENDLYDQFEPGSHPNIHRFQLLVKKLLGFTIPLFHARGVFNYDVGIMPYRRPLNVVVGRPVKVMQSSMPDQEYIDQVHAEYMAELQRVWDLWKDDFAPHREGELEILE